CWLSSSATNNPHPPRPANTRPPPPPRPPPLNPPPPKPRRVPPADPVPPSRHPACSTAIRFAPSWAPLRSAFPISAPHRHALHTTTLRRRSLTRWRRHYPAAITAPLGASRSPK